MSPRWINTSVLLAAALLASSLGCSWVNLNTWFAPDFPTTGEQVPIKFETSSTHPGAPGEISALVSVVAGISSTLAWGPPFIPIVPVCLWSPPPDPPAVSVVYRFEGLLSEATFDLSGAAVRTEAGLSRSPSSLNACKTATPDNLLVTLPAGACSVHATYDLVLAGSSLEVVPGVLHLGGLAYTSHPLRWHRESDYEYFPFLISR